MKVEKETVSQSHRLMQYVVLHKLSSANGVTCLSSRGEHTEQVTSHPGQLSLAIPPWTGAMIISTRNCTIQRALNIHSRTIVC